MRLQRHFNRKHAGKDYYKWAIVIPPETIEALKWQEGMELVPNVKGGKLILEALKSEV